MKKDADKRMEEREKNFKEENQRRVMIHDKVAEQKINTTIAVDKMKDENRELRNKIHKEI